MEKISRQEALAQGLSRYRTGRKCKHGHRAERFTSTSSCCECQALHNKAHRKTEAYQKTRRARYDRIYREDPARFLYDRALGRARRKGLAFDLTADYLRSIWPEDNRCPALGVELAPSVGTPTISGTATSCSPSLDRFDPALGYTQGNVAVISLKANQIKASSTQAADLRAVADWMDSVKGLS